MQVQNRKVISEQSGEHTPANPPSPQGRASDTFHDIHASETNHGIQRAPLHPVFRETADPVSDKPDPDQGTTKSKPIAPPRSIGIGWLLRRFIAFGLLFVTLGWLTIMMVFPVTNHALVNAHVVQVRAPIDGVADELRANLGDPVSVDEPLFRLGNPLADTSRLDALVTRQAELTARKRRLTQEINEYSRAEMVCRENCEIFKEGRLELLKALALEGNASRLMAEYQLESSRKQLERIQRLAKQNTVAAGDLDIGKADESVARKRVEREQASLLKTDTELKALSKGIFLQLETPYLFQRSDELRSKITLARANLKETDELLQATTREMEREQNRVQHLSKTTANSPVKGIVWTRSSNTGQRVKQNELMYEIADTSTIFVEAYVHQRHLKSVAVGSRATILLTGGQAHDGRVRAIRTPGLADSECSAALRLPNADLKQVRVIVGFDSRDVDPNLIGRHARVLLHDEHPTFLQRNLSWLFCLIGG